MRGWKCIGIKREIWARLKPCLSWYLIATIPLCLVTVWFSSILFLCLCKAVFYDCGLSQVTSFIFLQVLMGPILDNLNMYVIFAVLTCYCVTSFQRIQFSQTLFTFISRSNIIFRSSFESLSPQSTRLRLNKRLNKTESRIEETSWNRVSDFESFVSPLLSKATQKLHGWT